MNTAFNFKNFEPSPGLRDYALKRFDKLSKYISNAEGAEIVVSLSVEKSRQIVDVVISADYLHISAHEESDDMYSTIDLITDKLDAQVRKIREKMKDRRKQSRQPVLMEVLSFTDTPAGRTHSIVESDRFEPKPMPVEEAAEQLGVKHSEFLVFFNSETDRVNVIYRLKNGDFGLIDPGVGV